MFQERLINVLGRGLIVWLMIIAAEVIHGTIRRLFVEPLLGDQRARQFGVFIGSFLVLTVTFVFVRWLKGISVPQYLWVGTMWVILTLGFEILLGRLLMRLSWERIFADYDLVHGGLMPIGLLVMFLAPIVMAKAFDEI